MIHELYTDEEIADKCVQVVTEWDIETLIAFAAEELYHHYTNMADPDFLENFMEDNIDD